MKKIFLTLVIAVIAVSTTYAYFPEFTYQGEVNLGFATGGKVKYKGVSDKSSLNRPFIETIHGFGISKYGFLGLGFGVQGYLGAADKANPAEKWNTLALPLFVNVRGIWPVEELNPYVSASFGYAFIPCSARNSSVSFGNSTMISKLTGGFYCDCGVGVKLMDKINIGLGMQHQRMGTMAIFKQDYSTEKSRDKGLNGTSFYIKVGYCW